MPIFKRSRYSENRSAQTQFAFPVSRRTSCCWPLRVLVVSQQRNAANPGILSEELLNSLLNACTACSFLAHFPHPTSASLLRSQEILDSNIGPGSSAPTGFLSIAPPHPPMQEGRHKLCFQTYVKPLKTPLLLSPSEHNNYQNLIHVYCV
jgi:hypothetical protein